MKQFFQLLRFGGGQKALVLLTLLLTVERVSAQSAFITEYQASQVSMTTAHTNRYTVLQNDAQNQSVKIVSTADVRSKQAQGKLTFLLPGLADTLRAEATLIRDDAAGFVWSGQILNHPGYVSFTHANGLTSGFIQVGHHFYEILPMNTSYQFLVERDATTAKDCDDLHVSSDSLPPDPPGPNYCTFNGNEYNTCPAVIYMLLVITPAAKTYIEATYGDIATFVHKGQDLINQAFANSDIPNKEVAIKWIEKNYTTGNGLHNPVNLGFDRGNLPNLLEPERTDYKADVAFLITNQGYSNESGAAYDFGPDKDKAYALVEAPSLISFYQIAHELGFLLGCHHNWPVTLGNDNASVCAHGYRWIGPLGPLNSDPGYIYEPDTWGTLVSRHLSDGFLFSIDGPKGQSYLVQFPADYRILHYSNPDILYNGLRTGNDTAFIANNARQIRNTACEVADFFPSQDLSVFVTTSNCAIIPFTYTANITSPAPGLPGQGPYTVTWYWNDDGNFGSSFFGGGGDSLGTGTSLTVYQHPNYPYCIPYWIKCKVVAADGTQVSRIRKIDLNPNRCFCQAGTPPGNGHERSTNPSASDAGTFTVYPNPVDNGLLTLEKQSLANLEARATVADLSGRSLLNLPVFFDAGGQARLTVGALPDGLYLLWLRAGDGTCYHTNLIIAKN